MRTNQAILGRETGAQPLALGRVVSMPKMSIKKTGLKYAMMVLTGLILQSTSLKAEPGQTWQGLKDMLYKDRMILPGKTEVTLKAPYRAKDDRRVPVDVSVKLPGNQTIKKLTLIIDENPMPVSAEFEMFKPKNTMNFATEMRLNGPSTIRVIVEGGDGRLYMTERFVKTSGLGACSSPPVGDPEKLMANIGVMQFKDITERDKKKSTRAARMAHIKIKHPNLTGLQMDQITLRYILARFIKTIEVSQTGTKLFKLTGSISFSQDPELAFDYHLADGETLTVKVIDTEKAVFEQSFPLGIGS